MTDNIFNDEGQLRFAELMVMMRKAPVRLDSVGLVLAMDLEGTACAVCSVGLEESDVRKAVLKFLGSALAQLASEAMQLEPDALADVGRWFGEMQRERGRERVQEWLEALAGNEEQDEKGEQDDEQ